MYRLYRLTTETRQSVCWLGWDGEPVSVGDRVVRDDDATVWTVRAVSRDARDEPRVPYFTLVSVERSV